MFVRSLIADPPDLRVSGASEVLVPPFAKPQIAQSVVPSAVRSTGVTAGSTTIEPLSAPTPVTVAAQFENVEVSSVPAFVAVAVTASPSTGERPSGR